MISIHALREEGDSALPTLSSSWIKISIHALREEGDTEWPQNIHEYHNFYPRPPRGGRLITMHPFLHYHKFLSTPSARRATHPVDCPRFLISISIHALREEGDLGDSYYKEHKEISIHALREEGDANYKAMFFKALRISIHALREEGDVQNPSQRILYKYFYPRPPRGGRLENATAMNFNSTISIHALREEGDQKFLKRLRKAYKFLSTPSARRATTIRMETGRKITDFYPRPPRGGRPSR